ncbi:MAG TPA: DUF2510 domain-containing protein [Dermatophilaceae bacterium]
MSTEITPGWYAQPEGKQTYWNGRAWTQQRDLPARKTGQQRERQGKQLGLVAVIFTIADLVIFAIAGFSPAFVLLLMPGFLIGAIGLVMWAAGMARSS